VTLEELRRRAERAEWDHDRLDAAAEEAETEVYLAKAAGDTALERWWQERATQRREAADRAYDRLELADEAVAEAEWAIENPEEAAEEARIEATAGARAKEVINKLLREGKIDPKYRELMTEVAARL
jgi:hypothetical protein